MAFQQNGYTTVTQVVSYNEWRNYCLTHGVNVDWAYGNQCWDVCALLWYQYGLRLQTGPLGYAMECWTISRNVNARPPFVKIENKRDIKRGDVLVFRGVGSYSTGHICFADENYNGSDSLNCLGQNQGQGIRSGTPSNIVRLSLSSFIGAFRNTKWESSPEPEPTPTSRKRKGFNWVLYARKLRNKR